ncbi:MAG TPA: PspC domain-containing protein [Bacteroidales bacterium]|nr:PspC domain-containing protein [Bacteroidales bacterium]
MQTTKRLYRSRTDSVIAGVSGGLAKYLSIDPIIVRLMFVVLAIFGGGGVLIYIIAWIAVPLEPYDVYYDSSRYGRTVPPESGSAGAGFSDKEKANTEFDNTMLNPDEEMRKKQHEHKQLNEGSLIAGIILITLGGLFLASHFISRINFGDLWPVLLIVVGILIIFSRSREDKR